MRPPAAFAFALSAARGASARGRSACRRKAFSVDKGASASSTREARDKGKRTRPETPNCNAPASAGA